MFGSGQAADLSEHRLDPRSNRLMKGIVLFSLSLLVAVAAYAQDPVNMSPHFYKVLLENDRVRVLEYRLKPGEKEPMHSHPAGVVYVLSGARLRLNYPDGRTEEKTAATGETLWREPVTHAVENVGDSEAHAIAVDVKTALSRDAPLLRAPARDPAIVNSKTIHVQFENDRVRVLEAILPPEVKEQVHSHPANVVYVLEGGRYRNYAADGKITEGELKTGDVIYRDPLTHAAENIGDKTLHMILVELKDGK